MFEKENIVRVEFCRGSSPSIDVYLEGEVQPVSLFKGVVELSSENLSEKEIEAVIDILASKKRIMSMQRNFPQIYNTMLTELIEVQRKRYGVKKVKKRRLGYSVSRGKLEEIIGQYYNLEKVFIHSIYAGSNIQGAKTIELGSSKGIDDRVLYVNFHGAESEDE